MAEKKTYGLINEKGEEVGIYVGTVPRQAALKAANDGKTVIVLREKGTKKLHYFKGNRVLEPVSATAPAWIKASAAKNGGHVEARHYVEVAQEVLVEEEKLSFGGEHRPHERAGAIALFALALEEADLLEQAEPFPRALSVQLQRINYLLWSE
jgi:hypothetical protein